MAFLKLSLWTVSICCALNCFFLMQARNILNIITYSFPSHIYWRTLPLSYLKFYGTVILCLEHILESSGQFEKLLVLWPHPQSSQPRYYGVQPGFRGRRAKTHPEQILMQPSWWYCLSGRTWFSTNLLWSGEQLHSSGTVLFSLSRLDSKSSCGALSASLAERLLQGCLFPLLRLSVYPWALPW